MYNKLNKNMHEYKNYKCRTTHVSKFRRSMKQILKDVSTGKLITPEEKLFLQKYNNEQHLKNKRRK